jgi:hypothetical protein
VHHDVIYLLVYLLLQLEYISKKRTSISLNGATRTVVNGLSQLIALFARATTQHNNLHRGDFRYAALPHSDIVAYMRFPENNFQIAIMWAGQDKVPVSLSLG